MTKRRHPLPKLATHSMHRSGPTAYITERVAYPLAYDNISATGVSDTHAYSGNINNNQQGSMVMVDPSSVNTYFIGQQWAQPSVQHLIELMREVGVLLNS